MSEGGCNHNGSIFRWIVKGEGDFNRFGAEGGGQPETMGRSVEVKLARNGRSGSRGGRVERVGDDDGNGHLRGKV